MGLAANQARLLTLQSRMHDLELTSMRCTNEKILLTAMSNNIAIKYNDMLTEANNIGPDYITTTNTTNGSRTYNTAGTAGTAGGWEFNVPLDYNNLRSAGYEIKEKNVTANTDSTGSTEKVWKWYTTGGDAWQMPQTVEELINLLGNKGLIDLNPGASGWNTDGTRSTTETTYKALTGFQPEGEQECQYGKYYSASKLAKTFAESSTADTSSYNARVAFSQKKLEEILGSMGQANATPDDSKIGDSAYGYYEEGSSTTSSSSLLDRCKTDSELLKESIINGSIILSKDGQQLSLSDVATYNAGSQATEGTTDTETWTETSTIQTIDYSKRDAARQAAQNYYDAETAKMTIKEKGLDLRQKQAETEYSAACTEYESMKSLISENAERGFSLFG